MLDGDTRHHSGGERTNVKALTAIEKIMENAVLLKGIKIESTGGNPGVVTSYVTVPDIDSTISISDLFDIVKDLGKNFCYNSVNPAFLNEDGTPKILYHGTDAEFESFDPTMGISAMDIQGMFFSPWEIDTAGYGSKVGAYYVNLKNSADEGTAYAGHTT